MANLKDLIVNGVSRFLSPIFGTSGTFTGNVAVGGNMTITGKTTLGAAPENDMEAATKLYVDTHSGGGGDAGNAKVFYGTCATASATAAKVVTCADFTTSDMVEGVTLIVKFNNANSTNTAITLGIDGVADTTKSVKKNYYASSSTNGLRDLTYAAEIGAGTAIPFIFNGTYWVVAGMDVNINTIGYTEQSNNYLKNGTAYEDSSAGYFLGYTIFGFDKNGNALAISKRKPTATTAGTPMSTTRVYCSVGFDYTKGLRRCGSSSNFAAGADVDISPRINDSSIDFRYTDNVYPASGSTHYPLGLLPREPVYLRGKIGNGGLFYLDPTWVTYDNEDYPRVWVQPNDADNLSTNPFDTSHVYWFIGYPAYNSSYPSNSYQLDLFSHGGLYYYDGTNLLHYDNLALLKTGGTMTGDIDMNGNQILHLPLATQNGDAVPFEQALVYDQSLNSYTAKGLKIYNVANPTNSNDAANKQYVDDKIYSVSTSLRIPSVAVDIAYLTSEKQINIVCLNYIEGSTPILQFNNQNYMTSGQMLHIIIYRTSYQAAEFNVPNNICVGGQLSGSNNYVFINGLCKNGGSVDGYNNYTTFYIDSGGIIEMNIYFLQVNNEYRTYIKTDSIAY